MGLRKLECDQCSKRMWTWEAWLACMRSHERGLEMAKILRRGLSWS